MLAFEPALTPDPTQVYRPGVCHRTPGLLAGGHGAREPPDPIPNSEVKPRCADGTAGATRWESTAPPAHLSHNARSDRLRSGRAVGFCARSTDLLVEAARGPRAGRRAPPPHPPPRPGGRARRGGRRVGGR